MRDKLGGTFLRKEMKAIFQTGIRRFEIREIPKPVPGKGEVLLRVKTVGICGSDVHYWNEGRIGDQIPKFPFVLGHECAGVVEECGAGITDISAGTIAAFEPGVSCGVCEICRSGHYNACPQVRFLGSPPINGAFQEFIVGKHCQILPLASPLSIDDGVMLEPLSIGAYAVRMAGFQSADTAAVIGSGPIGMSVASVLKASGACQIIMIEKHADRAAYARSLAGDHVIAKSSGEAVKTVQEITSGRGVDFVFEASGSTAAFAHATDMARICGTVVFVGISSDDMVPLPMHAVRRKELLLKTVRREAFGYHLALSLRQKGLVDPLPWITHRFAPEQVNEAFALVSQYKDKVLKAVIDF